MMAIAEASNEHRSSASNDNATALVAVIGDRDAISRRIVARLDALAPNGWTVETFADFEAAAASAHPPAALIILVCGDHDRFDTDTLTQGVQKAAHAPLIVAGTELRLPSPGTCVRAGVCQRVDIEEDVYLIDVRLSRALDLARDRRRLAELERHSEAAPARLDGDRLVGVTPHFANLVGAESAEAINGQPLSRWLPNADVARLAAACADLETTQAPTSRGVILRRASAGVTHPLSAHLYTDTDHCQWLAIAPLGATSVPMQGLAPTADARMALHRHLAGVNRCSDSGRSRGLIFVAIDGVDALQQQLGLASADALLEEAGLLLIDELADTDRCFRFGVGEYVLSLERGAEAEVTTIAQALLRAVGANEFGDQHRSRRITASVSSIMLGAEATANDHRLQQLVETGHQLRASGRGSFRECSYDASADAPIGSDAWQARLKLALASDRFRLAFQAITSLAGDDRRVYDVLLRYVDDQDSLVMPGKFLPAAEEAGLMPEVDRWVTRRAARVIAHQAVRNVEVTLFVKLSHATLDDSGTFLNWLAEDDTLNAIEHGQIVFCVREFDARSQLPAIRRLAAGLDQQGFPLALTHFGASSGRVATFDNLALSFIKLAPSFSRQVAEQDNQDERLQSIIDFARKRNLPLIAEQVEDTASMARLWQVGVNYIQGYFIQEPDPSALPQDDTVG